MNWPTSLRNVKLKTSRGKRGVVSIWKQEKLSQNLGSSVLFNDTSICGLKEAGIKSANSINSTS